MRRKFRVAILVVGLVAATAVAIPTAMAAVSPAAGPTAAQLLARVKAGCTKVSKGNYKSDEDAKSATISICKAGKSFVWNADMDIDCDGGRTAICRGDPAYQSETSATTSTGQPLDAATVPFFVIPLPRSGFDYSTHGIELGSVGAVIYRGQVIYGVFGDEGPSTIIGEASYALASMLGVDADPVTGGVDNGVTYIVFTGPSGVVTRNEDHAEATSVGQMRAAQLLADN
jgi:hypothetical protein